MNRGPGSTCRLTYDCGRPSPVEGDLIRSTAGACYLVDAVRESRSRPGRWILDVVRLERDAAAEGDPGVWSLRWHRR